MSLRGRLEVQAGQVLHAVKVLHVEDNPENRMLVRAVLEAEGCTVVDAVDGPSGIQAALAEGPAVILLDINIPGVAGYEVAGILKSFPDLASTPIIAVTAFAMRGDRERLLAAGCDGYIPKPIDVDAFPGQVAEFLRGKRERVPDAETAKYLREVNQRLVTGLLHQLDELKRLNQETARRAGQLEDLHVAVQGVTAELGVRPLLERLLASVRPALEAAELTVELTSPCEIRVTVTRGPDAALDAIPVADSRTDAEVVEWTVPVTVHGRQLGSMMLRRSRPDGPSTDQESLLKLVANQVGIAIENARLYEDVVRQMAELKQAEAQLVHSAKLAAIGELVARVAHELNNPLTTVLGFATSIAERLESSDPLQEKLRWIRDEASRAAEIVHDLLDFGRQREFMPQPDDITELLEQLVGMLRRQNAFRLVTVTETYARDLPTVRVDRARMKQVFLNIINNALQATGPGGSLTLTTRATPDGVQVTIGDTGAGIAAEHLERIFEPFFTTKSRAGGTGLGLSVSHGIVQGHGGAIRVTSEVGKGTTFMIDLPGVARTCSMVADRQTSDAAAPGARLVAADATGPIR